MSEGRYRGKIKQGPPTDSVDALGCIALMFAMFTYVDRMGSRAIPKYFHVMMSTMTATVSVISS